MIPPGPASNDDLCEQIVFYLLGDGKLQCVGEFPLQNILDLKETMGMSPQNVSMKNSTF
jgi:hypothetical protein